MTQPSIKIFACDYRNIKDKWNLPFIRLGDSHSNAILNIGDDIENNKYAPAMSELDKIWWVAKHIEEFGKTDYVGFCHYRRFFTHIKAAAVFDIKAEQFNPGMLITPEQELSLIINGGYAGCSHQPLQVTPPGIKPIWKQIEHLDYHLKADRNKLLFDMFLKRSPENLKESLEKAFYETTEYLCNIFTLRRDLFLQFSSMAFPALVEFDATIDPETKKEFHPRYLGYYGERLVSVYLHALRISGLKILHLPLLTVDCWRHNRVVKDSSGRNVEVLEQ